MKNLANQAVDISLFDAAGKLVFNQKTNFTDNQLRFKAPSVSGMYLLKIALENKAVQIGKVLVF